MSSSIRQIRFRLPINIYKENDVSFMGFSPFPSKNELNIYLDMQEQHNTALWVKSAPVPLPPTMDISHTEKFESM